MEPTLVIGPNRVNLPSSSILLTTRTSRPSSPRKVWYSSIRQKRKMAARTKITTRMTDTGQSGLLKNRFRNISDNGFFNMSFPDKAVVDVITVRNYQNKNGKNHGPEPIFISEKTCPGEHYQPLDDYRSK